MKLKLPILLISASFLFACSSSDDTASVQSIQEPSVANDVDQKIEAPEMISEAPNSKPNTDLTPIPMSDLFENGRYFLMSHTTDNGIEDIEYMRKGNDNTSYARMQIRCSNNEIKKYSADNTDALKLANMGDWITPTPDWTDQDIVNFICK